MKTITINRETINVEVEPCQAARDGWHVMGLFDREDNVIHLQVETDARRKELEDAGDNPETGSYWQALTGRNIANFLASRGGAPLSDSILLKFRKSGGSFVSAE
jgi:hypothetical protein